MNLHVGFFELSSLACDAAVEIDLLINGESNDFQSIHQLATILYEILHGNRASQLVSLSPAIGTEMQMVLGQAFMATGVNQQIILDRLSDRVEQTIHMLHSVQSGTENFSLTWLRDFCLALSQTASTHRQMILDLRPYHPYRRLVSSSI